MAFEFDRDEIIEFLLEKGICYNWKYYSIVTYCIRDDNHHILALLVQRGIVKLLPNKTFYFDIELITIWDFCIKWQRKNVLEYIINNHPQMIPDVILKLLLEQKSLDKYNFIKMLIDRNIIDIPD
jgi:hypothetical protein